MRSNKMRSNKKRSNKKRSNKNRYNKETKINKIRIKRNGVKKTYVYGNDFEGDSKDYINIASGGNLQSAVAFASSASKSFASSVNSKADLYSKVYRKNFYKTLAFIINFCLMIIVDKDQTKIYTFKRVLNEFKDSANVKNSVNVNLYPDNNVISLLNRVVIYKYKKSAKEAAAANAAAATEEANAAAANAAAANAAATEEANAAATEAATAAKAKAAAAVAAATEAATEAATAAKEVALAATEEANAAATEEANAAAAAPNAAATEEAKPAALAPAASDAADEEVKLLKKAAEELEKLSLIYMKDVSAENVLQDFNNKTNPNNEINEESKELKLVCINFLMGKLKEFPVLFRNRLNIIFSEKHNDEVNKFLNYSGKNILKYSYDNYKKIEPLCIFKGGSSPDYKEIDLFIILFAILWKNLLKPNYDNADTFRKATKIYRPPRDFLTGVFRTDDDIFRDWTHRSEYNEKIYPKNGQLDGICDYIKKLWLSTQDNVEKKGTDDDYNNITALVDCASKLSLRYDTFTADDIVRTFNKEDILGNKKGTSINHKTPYSTVT